MPQYFKEHGERLVELGYRIVPLPPGSKGPRLTGWQKLNLSAADVRRKAANGASDAGIGILAATTPAIDVDVMDVDVAQQMSDEIDRIFAGEALMTRTGMAPKFLIPFRTDKPFRKITSSTYTDGEHDHRIEILGDGQQWVAFHIHPSTGKPYEWFDGISDEGIRAVRHEDLPSLDARRARAVVDAFERIASERVSTGQWSCKQPHSRVANVAADDDSLKGYAPGTGVDVAATLSRIPNADVDYDRWFTVLAAVHHETDGGGRELAYEWSCRSAKHTDERFNTTWNSLGRSSARPITLRTLLKDAKPKAPDEPSGKKFTVHDEATYQRDFSSVSWLVKNVLPHAEFGAIYGASGSGKTFFALDLAYTIARGEEWRGLKTRKSSRVIYVASEASRGIKKRLVAYNQEFGQHGGPGIVDEAPDLQSLTQATELADAIGAADLVIVDTMAASQSGDENSAKDMGIFIACCKHIAQQTGAMVLVVHHSGNSNTDRMRGSSALFAAADVVLEVSKREDGTNGVVVTKQKDGETGEEFGFRLRQVKVGTDADNEPITSCVLEQREDAAPKATAKDNGGNFDTSPTYRKARWFLRTLTDMTNGEPVNVKLEELYEALELFAQRDNVAFRARDSANTLRTLEAKGKIVREGPWVRLCGISREECEDLAKS